MSRIGVVHLVRKCNGIEPFRNFLESYLRHPAGIDHDLLLIYKGFDGESDCAPYEAIVEDIKHSCLLISDRGLDLRAYILAAQAYPNRYLCFLNSFSIIMADNWLIKLWIAIQVEGIGLVGASGSWGSVYSLSKNKKKRPLLEAIAYFILWHPLRLYLGHYFNPFPNYHIRTNGFMIRSNLLLTIHHGSLRTKMSTYKLESGKKSLTQQVISKGMDVRVVDCHGVTYSKSEWNVSNTFWHGDQAQLLISDNQSRKYTSAKPDEKLRLTLFAWKQNAVIQRSDCV
jgi:hypothetical protein